MSNIEFDTKGSVMLLLCDYKKILQEKIDKVCQKIGFNDSDISWYIYDPKQNKNSIDQIFVGLNGRDYGYCIPHKKEIYISTLSIQKDVNSTLLKKYSELLKLPKTDDFLANVIIDEITHIQTKQNHGNSEYEKKFIENANKFYLSPIERIMSRIKK